MKTLLSRGPRIIISMSLCLLSGLCAQSAQALESYDAAPAEVFARALTFGQASAVETYIAEEHPDLENELPGPAQTRLRPMSLVITQLHSHQRSALSRQKPLTTPVNEAALVNALLRFGAQSVYQEPDLEDNTPLHLVFGLPPNLQQKVMGTLFRFHGDRNLTLENARGETPVTLAKKAQPALGKQLEKHKPSGLSDYQIRSAPFAYAKGVRIYEQLAREQSLANAVKNKDFALATTWLNKVSPDTYALYPAGQPLLHHMARFSDDRWLKLWQSQQADFTIKNLQRQQVLHTLVQQPPEGYAAAERLALLLAAGARLNARDNEGMTPLQWAKKANQQVWVDVLVKAGAR